MQPVVKLVSEPSPPVAGSLLFRVSERKDVWLCIPIYSAGTFSSSSGLLAGPLLDGSFGLLSNFMTL